MKLVNYKCQIRNVRHVHNSPALTNPDLLYGTLPDRLGDICLALTSLLRLLSVSRDAEIHRRKRWRPWNLLLWLPEYGSNVTTLFPLHPGVGVEGPVPSKRSR